MAKAGKWATCLAAKAVQRAALPLERIDDVQSRHGLAARVLGVGDRVTDDILKEHLGVGAHDG